VKRLRVLVVDDSASIRKVLSDAISHAPDLELCGTAPNGQVALERLKTAAPDVITLDIEMPVMDGISTLRALRVLRPRLPVLMFSSHTVRGALATLDALAAGASDFVAKPAVSGPAEATAFVDLEVLPRLRALGGRAAEPLPAAQARPAGAPASAAAPLRSLDRAGRPPLQAVVVAVSTGGPQALASFLPALPRSLPVPVLVVQHMPPLFTRILAERLSGLGPNPVVEGTDGLTAAPGRVVLAPGGTHHMVVRPGALGSPPLLRLDDGPPENSCRPAADPLFRSAAEIWGKGLLGVVLTGMGRDGCIGAARILERGGTVLAQDRTSSVVWGMPGAVVEAGMAEAELTIAELAAVIGRRMMSPLAHLQPAARTVRT
jgi:two-component system, chemotaxis family, protein-glutamate methylesterase/glutaminase